MPAFQQFFGELCIAINGIGVYTFNRETRHSIFDNYLIFDHIIRECDENFIITYIEPRCNYVSFTQSDERPS